MKLYLQPGEKVLYQDGPKGQILILWFFKSMLLAIPISLFFSGFVNFAAIAFALTGFIFSFILTFILVFIILFLYHIALRMTYKYHITNERIIFEGGILMKRIKSVPYHKVTDVSISQNIVERILGIARANIHTAGTGMQHPEIQFSGLSDPEKPQSIVVKRLRVFQTTRHASAYSE